MNTLPAAPRAAYLLTAAMADNTQRAGAIVAGDDMSAECAHCREVIAKAMCSLQIQAYFASDSLS